MNYENEDWFKKEILNFEQISITDFKKLRIRPQLALVAATELEQKFILKELEVLPLIGKCFSIQLEKQTYFIGQFGAFCTVFLRTSMGAIGPTAATVSTMNLITKWNPHAIVSVGIAMGYNKNKHKPGDVLVSSHIATYESVKLVNGLKINRADTPSASPILINRFQNKIDWKFQRPDMTYCNIHIGKILAGDKLINDENFKIELWNSFPEAIGAEMEGSGIWSACANQDKAWVIVKAVCDWGDGDKNDEFQPLAIASAVSLCKSVFMSKTALDGIAKINYSSKITQINSFKLFFHREFVDKFSIDKLNHLTKISRARISSYESLDLEKHGLSLLSFPKCTNSDLSKLEKALQCPRGFLSAGNENDFYSYYLSYYFKNKLKNEFLINKYTKIKSIVFDFDGTLTTSDINKSSWQRIWKKLGYEQADCDKYFSMYINKEIEHQEWCDITCKKFKDKKFSKSDLIDIANEIQLNPSVINTLTLLRKCGVKLHITSGSILELIQIIFGKYIDLFEDVKANRFSFDKNNIISSITGTLYDFEGKANYVKELIEKDNLKPYEIMFVGNSKNDDWAYQSGGRTLCINPHDTTFSNSRIWHHTIRSLIDLEEILPYIIDKDMLDTIQKIN
jgi:HAD superfamily phosphoserine phosphatase-like hydrolase